ncbi:UDP-glucose dehydrogenase family protein [Noviherbaspirillum denitrificans]|uniref:UDP-glucose 6-dehydrogenase n=1 Tax=Noviherbaspirillum denitrificans TaxID=1968433 RepID=A0A254TGZ8_9BURK|nr:UDP-glucose/GDP-mannose dehydrogenase family protein [Noviherbaspirillum denitrificans]OWW19813.1 UDP-glucose 6-dehydrogenase [Noviherbaspirillum denitrificans]
MKISIIGTGYVGLVTAACLAEAGNMVICVDVDEQKIALLNRGRVTIHEPGLPQLIARNRRAGRLAFMTGYEEAVQHAEVIFLAVGTPSEEDGSADLTHVLGAARLVGRHLRHPAVVVNKSTVPVGTAARVRAVIAEELAARRVDIAFSIVSNPEFLREGSAVNDFMHPDRVVLGYDDTESAGIMRELYIPFLRQREQLIEIDTHSAELSKYAANVMLATRISLMNELACVAEAVGADIEAVRRCVAADPRIGPLFLQAGIGYGGSCLPKDVKALIRTATQSGCAPHLLKATDAVNEKQKSLLFRKICNHYGGPRRLEGKTIALWGLSFKPNTGDMREAPSLALIEQLLGSWCRIRACDPVACDEAARVLRKAHGAVKFAERVHLTRDPWEAVEGADALVLATEWKEFRAPDFSRLAAGLNDKVVFDGRNLYDPQTVQAAGLRYYGIGRKA